MTMSSTKTTQPSVFGAEISTSWWQHNELKEFHQCVRNFSLSMPDQVQLSPFREGRGRPRLCVSKAKMENQQGEGGSLPLWVLKPSLEQSQATV